jgi:FMN phosphatase YigB (HAD superfamily)
LASARTGLDVAFCRKLLDAIDGLQATCPNAFNRDRFPKSLKAASLALDAIAGQRPDFEAARLAFDIGDSVFQESYPLFDEVENVLTELKKRGVILVLNTKGDENVQRMKITRNGLDKFFDYMFITPAKDAQYYEQLIHTLSLDRETTVFVGDSLRDDIAIPSSLGFKTILISKTPPSEWKAKWSYEQQVNASVNPTWWTPTISSILTLPGIELPPAK